jgi:hypothetical protein
MVAALMLAAQAVMGSPSWVWPSGTSWDESSNEVVLPGRDRVPVGGKVQLEGGTMAPSELARLPVRGSELTEAAARSCAALGEVVSFAGN